jgi:hypothetical protein
VGDATGATAPGNPGGLMMIWIQPQKGMRRQRRARADNPVIFMTIVDLFIRRI